MDFKAEGVYADRTLTAHPVEGGLRIKASVAKIDSVMVTISEEDALRLADEIIARYRSEKPMLDPEISQAADAKEGDYVEYIGWRSDAKALATVRCLDWLKPGTIVKVTATKPHGIPKYAGYRIFSVTGPNGETWRDIHEGYFAGPVKVERREVWQKLEV